ncbi:MAG: DUF2934 domain-containing protein [Candidatus Omnitrophica bacterium]|nr:DUF2934 domain-containing protein [Candidatus Omnitrophota bacterium]
MSKKLEAPPRNNRLKSKTLDPLNVSLIESEPVKTTHNTVNGGYIPSFEEIQRRAYEIYERKGGSETENWLEAEQLLKEEQSGQTASVQANSPDWKTR